MLRRLSLRQLTVFLEAARTMNFARAAEALHLTQPAISMQIRQLEGVVGLPLFERIGKRLALTPAGELFRHHAARVLGELQDAEQALQSMRACAADRPPWFGQHGEIFCAETARAVRRAPPADRHSVPGRQS